MKTAGDLLIDAVAGWLPHATMCAREECQACAVSINQLRLAYKVWEASRYQAATPTAAAQRDALDQRLKRLEVLLGGVDLEERIEGLRTDQAIAWLSHGRLSEDNDRLRARLDALETTR